MRKSFALFVLSVTVLFSCTLKDAKKQENTIANLKTAIEGETTVCYKYAAYAEQASKEGEESIANLFEAASKSESVHAKAHMIVLANLMGKIDEFDPVFEVKSTAENLQDAIDGETKENQEMYPGFILEAKSDHLDEAERSYTWAMTVEKKHQAYFTNALEAFYAHNTTKLPKSYSVCSKCGYTYPNSELPDVCVLCKNDK